jgi:alkaline phosphatase D
MKIFTLIVLLLAHFHLFSQDTRNSLRVEQAPFFHGVASGDPLHNRVIIWTRVTPEQINEEDVSVSWRIATDTSMTNIVNQGVFVTNQTRDYTVKVDVTNLQPSTCYFYDFKVGERYSVRGRAITADLGDNENVRFAVVSCSNYQYGFFNAYRTIAERNDVNAVLHLGDYIYEYGAGGYSANIEGRDHEPVHEIVTLDDYRLRYSHYRLDHDLQRIHQQYPFICVWDDHESANDSWVEGADNHDESTQGMWGVRKNNSKQAYFEWLPIREQNEEFSIYRKIQYGDLVNLFMLDTRLEGRNEQVGATSSEINNPNRTLLGTEQLDWLKTNLSNSTARWNILGQQVMMAPLKAFGTPVNTDQWDGYPVERESILQHIVSNSIDNVVVLTGDIHTSWANDLPLNGYNATTGANSAGVEFVTTSVTSPGFPIGVGVSLIQSMNSHIKWADLTKRGYILLDINKNRTQAEWYFMDDINTANNNQTFGKAYFVNHQERFLRAASLTTVSENQCIAAPPHPYNPADYVSTNENNPFTLFGIYPNPFDNYFILHLGAIQAEMISVSLYDISGKLVFQQAQIPVNGSSEYFKLYTESLAKGSYQLLVESSQGKVSHKLVKE